MAEHSRMSSCGKLDKTLGKFKYFQYSAKCSWKFMYPSETWDQKFVFKDHSVFLCQVLKWHCGSFSVDVVAFKAHQHSMWLLSEGETRFFVTIIISIVELCIHIMVLTTEKTLIHNLHLQESHLLFNSCFFIRRRESLCSKIFRLTWVSLWIV